MRIVFVLNSLGAGGTERSTAVLLPFLRSAGFDVHVICFKDTGEGDQQRILQAGFPIRILKSVGWVGRIRETRGILRSLDPDITHSALFEADVFTRIASIGLKTTVISSLVNTPYDARRFNDPRISRWRLRVFQLVDAVTGRILVDRFHAVSQGVAKAGENALGIPSKKITVVRRGRERDEPSDRSQVRLQVRSALGIHPNSKVILAVGREEYQKGHCFLIEASSTLAKEFPDLIVLIAGRQGNSSSELDRLMTEIPTAPVRRLGYRSDIRDLLIGSDIFVMPSLYEGTAGAAIEAMMYGCPVVCSKLDGVEGVLEHNVNSTLVEPENTEQIVRACSELLNAPEKGHILAARALDDYETSFTMRAHVTAMIAMYEEATGH